MITDDILKTILETKAQEPTTDFLDWPSMSLQLLAKETVCLLIGSWYFSRSMLILLIRACRFSQRRMKQPQIFTRAYYLVRSPDLGPIHDSPKAFLKGHII